MNETLRLTEVTYSFATGGSERIAADVAEHVVAAGGLATACATHGGRGAISERLESAGIPAVPLDVGAGRVGKSVVLWRHLSRFRPHTLHVHHLNMLAAVYRTARKAGVQRIVCTEHTDREVRNDPSSRALAQRYGPQVELLTVVYPGMAEYFARVIAVPRSEIRVIPNGVDVELFRPRLEESRTNPDGRTVLGYVGRLHPDKDPMNLLRAVAKLGNSERKKLRIAVVGDGQCREQAHRFVEAEDLGETVQFLGEQARIPELLRDWDALVLPSRTEGLPVAVLEAMSTGLPVIATDVGGVREAVADAGVIVPPEDPSALADAIRSIVTDPQLRGCMGRRARERAVSSYDRKTMLSAYMSALFPQLRDRSSAGDA